MSRCRASCFVPRYAGYPLLGWSALASIAACGTGDGAGAGSGLGSAVGQESPDASVAASTPGAPDLSPRAGGELGAGAMAERLTPSLPPEGLGGGAVGDAGSPDEANIEAAPDAAVPCPGSGQIEYRLNGAESWPPEVRQALSEAMDEAVHYYNCYSTLSHSLTVNYNEGVPTAEANVDGWMSFGSNRGYMVVATAMHEIAHTLGVGYFPWGELLVNGRWVGPAVVQLISSLPSEQRDADEFSQRGYITADTQHFWPYGLNQAAEHQSEWSLINHVRLVAAMQEDKQAYSNGAL